MQQNIKTDAFDIIATSSLVACEQINDFSSQVLQTRGGRVGSGMGGLLEALWGYYTNVVLSKREKENYEIAWFPSHQFHDFACVLKDLPWNPETKEGELFRIEAKSMNYGADESKAHFDVLQEELDDFDALLLLVWDWADLDGQRRYPRILDSFFGPASPIAKLRDALHLTRGGTFVDRHDCPDRCAPHICIHHGEPLNENGKRERLSGPDSCRPSARVSYAANFGGLVRMLKTRRPDAKRTFRRVRREDFIANQYINFIHRNYPAEERNHYSRNEWSLIAQQLGINPSDREIVDLHKEIRMNPCYSELILNLE